MKTLGKLLQLILFAAALALPVAGALAQSYPNRSIRLIVPYPPGGGNDIVARAIGHKLAERLGQAVVVENKPGGGTLIGAQLAAKAAPDGYTLFIGTIATMAINTSLYKTLPYDAVKDFAPITQLVNYPLILVAHPSVPAGNVAELLALAKTKPINYASFGNGSSPHLGTELLKSMTGTQMLHVPYKGGTPALMDLMSGQVSMMFIDMPPAIGQIKSGRIKALAVSSPQRSPLLPEVPSVSETVPGFGFDSWAGLFAPAGTPPAVIARLHDEVAQILSQAEIKNQLSGLGAEPSVNTPQQFAAMIRSETSKWAKVVKASGAQLD